MTNIFRNFALATVIALTACSAAQKAEEKAALRCLGNEDVQLAEAVAAHDYAAITADLFECAKQAVAAKAAAQAGSGSGSGSGS